MRALCDGLDIPRRLAGLADEEDDTERRQFLGGTLGAVGAAALPARSDIGDEELLRVTSSTYRRIEQRTPTRMLVGPATANATLVLQLAQRADGGQQARMYAAASEAAGLAAWLYADLADPGQTRRHYRLSIGAAQRSGIPLLTAYMQASLGHYATGNGAPMQGLRLIREASAALPRSAPRTALAWLAALEGVALGYLGDRAALRSLDLADRHADTARDDEPVWPWVFKFDTAKIATHRAHAAARLGIPNIAEQAFARAAVSHSPKQAAVLAVEHARSLAAAGDTQRACRTALDAYTTGQTYGSERVRRAVEDFRTSFGPRLGNAVEQLDQRLHATYMENA